jgi:hypothetical protein
MRMTARLRTVLALAAALTLPIAPRVAAGDETILEGSYRLVKRVLPNGRKVSYPDIVGFMTYTKTERHFNIMWKDPKGAPVSLSLIATYTLSGGKYCEKPVYWMQNNMGMPGISYEWPKEKRGCAEAATDASSTSFDVPGEPERMRFTREGFVATAKAMWTDTWKRVE